MKMSISKPKEAVFIQDSPLRYSIKAPYDADLLVPLREYPGIYWDGNRKVRTLWKDSLPYAEKLFSSRGYKIVKLFGENDDTKLNLNLVHDLLYDYQKRGIDFCLKNHRCILNFEMGLGKTPTAIGVAEQLSDMQPQFNAIVVCPALVRLNWEKEFDRWWPSHSPIFRINKGTDLKKYDDFLKDADNHIVIISYALLSKLLKKECLPKFDLIIGDEFHYVKNRKAGRSKSFEALSTGLNDKSFIIGLTGTPISTEPTDLWNQANILRPKSLGGFTSFKERYCEMFPDAYAYSGVVFKGLDKDKAPELKLRLESFVMRVTKHEVAHLLPPNIIQGLRIPTSGKVRPINFSKLSANEKDDLVKIGGDKKVDATVKCVMDALAAGEEACALAYYRDTCEKIEAALNEELDKLSAEDPVKNKQVVYVNGSLPVEKRMQIIEQAKKDKNILIATISSVNVGIDLTHWTTAIFGELYWQPMIMIQGLGRFSRLSGKLPSTCVLLVIEGSIDETIASVLEERTRTQAKLFNVGHSEEGLIKSLEASDEDFARMMDEALSSRSEEVG